MLTVIFITFVTLLLNYGEMQCSLSEHHSRNSNTIVRFNPRTCVVAACGSLECLDILINMVQNKGTKLQ